MRSEMIFIRSWSFTSFTYTVHSSTAEKFSRSLCAGAKHSALRQPTDITSSSKKLILLSARRSGGYSGDEDREVQQHDATVTATRDTRKTGWCSGRRTGFPAEKKRAHDRVGSQRGWHGGKSDTDSQVSPQLNGLRSSVLRSFLSLSKRRQKTCACNCRAIGAPWILVGIWH